MRLPLWIKATLLAIPAVLLVIFFVLIAFGWYVTRQIDESGGVLRPSMAAYDVRHYALEISVDPALQEIRGVNRVTVAALDRIERFELHLDDHLEVTSIEVDGVAATWRHDDGIVGVGLAEPWPAGGRHEVAIGYGGRPKTALRPPWVDGFVWAETQSGAPWVGVTSEGDGGDSWWPCKDHPSDEPDEGMDITLTVPAGLVGLSNGRKVGETVNPDGTVTTRWQVGFPINNYCVTVNIGPYEPVPAEYHGVDGRLDETLLFWTTPGVAADVERLAKQLPMMVDRLGRRFGEYPFFADKLWVVFAPYLGMEHQTLIAYGADFRDNRFGFDELLLHELAHEWWGNKITAADWGDFWLHEGFATYAEALYVLDTAGGASYLEYMQVLRARMTNRVPLVQGHGLTTVEAYTPDLYGKGAWVLHMLRLLLQDQRFDTILWRFADGDHPGACRLVTTLEFTDLVEQVSTWDLGWFWQRYLYTAALPTWSTSRVDEGGAELVVIEWDDAGFEMPLPVAVGDRRRLVAMPDGRAEIRVPSGTPVVVDPDREVLTAN